MCVGVRANACAAVAAEPCCSCCRGAVVQLHHQLTKPSSRARAPTQLKTTSGLSASAARRPSSTSCSCCSRCSVRHCSRCSRDQNVRVQLGGVLRARAWRKHSFSPWQHPHVKRLLPAPGARPQPQRPSRHMTGFTRVLLPASGAVQLWCCCCWWCARVGCWFLGWLGLNCKAWGAQLHYRIVS